LTLYVLSGLKVTRMVISKRNQNNSCKNKLCENCAGARCLFTSFISYFSFNS